MGSWRGRTCAIYAKIGQKQRLSPQAGHQGRVLHPKFCQQPFYMIKLQFESKKEHAQTFGQLPPSGNLPLTSTDVGGYGSVQLLLSSVSGATPQWKTMRALT